MVKGETINMLTMISNPYPGVGKYNNRAMFQCKCGNTKEILVKSVVYGRTKSCGCIQLDYARRRSYTHGATYTRLYKIWTNMKTRCYNPNYKDPQYYSDKGIAICDEWVNDFAAFREWSLEHGYADDLTIDRIDGNKGYSADNCRWATPKQQSRNRMSNNLITIGGETRCLIEWCEKLNLPYATIEMRIRRGWNKEEAVLTPIRRRAYAK